MLELSVLGRNGAISAFCKALLKEHILRRADHNAGLDHSDFVGEGYKLAFKYLEHMFIMRQEECAQLFDAGVYAQYFAPSVSYASADFAVYTAALQKAVDVLRQRGGTTKGAMFYELGGGIGKAGAPPL